MMNVFRIPVQFLDEITAKMLLRNPPIDTFVSLTTVRGSVGGAVALWLEHWTPDRAAVLVRALAGALRCLLKKDNLILQCF